MVWGLLILRPLFSPYYIHCGLWHDRLEYIFQLDPTFDWFSQILFNDDLFQIGGQLEKTNAKTAHFRPIAFSLKRIKGCLARKGLILRELFVENLTLSQGNQSESQFHVVANICLALQKRQRVYLWVILGHVFACEIGILSTFPIFRESVWFKLGWFVCKGLLALTNSFIWLNFGLTQILSRLSPLNFKALPMMMMMILIHNTFKMVRRVVIVHKVSISKIMRSLLIY